MDAGGALQGEERRGEERGRAAGVAGAGLAFTLSVGVWEGKFWQLSAMWWR